MECSRGGQKVSQEFLLLSLLRQTLTSSSSVSDSTRMVRLSSIAILVLLLVLWTQCAWQIEATSKTAKLIKYAASSGRGWANLLSENSKYGLGRRHSLDETDMCVPGQTCHGPVIQVFFSATCDWSQTYGFFQLYSEFNAFSKCEDAEIPSMGSMATCSNETGFFVRSLYDNTQCKGDTLKIERFKVGTCMDSPNGPAQAFWCDARDAFSLSNSKPQPVDLTAPDLPDIGTVCSDSFGAPNNTSCDPRFPIMRTYKKQNGNEPQCPSATPHDLESHYLFGTGASNTCYLDGFNTWYNIHSDKKSFDLIKTAGCSSDHVLYSLTQRFGCMWDEESSNTTIYTRPGQS